MIPQITEINFPSYATLNSATITLSEMGDRNITTQIKIDGDIVPDFSGWELEFKGERFILPVKEPQAAKDNTSRRSIVDLTFSSWAVQEMKRYFFVEMTSIESGTAIADKYKASLGLNIENFVTAFNNVLNYYFNGNIEMDLFGSGTGIYSAEPAFFEIDYTHIWDVLQKIYEIYQVRWTITYDSSNEKYVIKVGYPAAEIDDHDFEYGYEGGLLRFERQVQDYDITNVLLGRGGEKNLPYRYFKKVDPGNPNWAADPDAIPELKNIYFENLRDINFRRYVQGWKTNPNRILEEGDVVETYDSARGETDFAYAKGHTDERFNPVEYVKDDASIAIYGERWGALENADDIYPTIQGIEVDPYGRIDQVVDVESVTTDDIEAMAADAAEVTNVAGASRTEWINYNSTLELDINGADFSVPEGKVGNLTIQNTWFDTILYAKRGNDQVNVDPADAVHELVSINTTLSYVTVVNRNTGTELPPAGIPAGNYFYKLHIVVKAEFESSMYNSVNVTVGVNGMKLTTSEGSANAWKPTFDIWIKNIWDTTQQSGESDEQYAARVWEPILGDRTGEEAKVAFSTGFLSISEDYNFTIASIPVVDRTKTIDGVASEWRITLIKSDAEYEATGKYIPNAETGGNASAGDYFFFTGIDMPWAYVLWAEEKLNAYKTAELAKLKQINPTWIIRIDKVRANTKEQGELEYLADRFASGAKLRVKDKRFTNGQVLTLYVQTVTYTWQEPSNGNPYLVPDIEVVLSDKVETVASPIDQLEGSVDLIQSTYAKISDIESAIRRVASPIFLKKTGESERSLSPTRFSSLMASESFRQGDIGGQGWGAYTDGEGHSVLEADTIVVRKDMRVNTLTVNQIAYLGGKQIISAAAMECTKVDDTDSGYVCYFDQKQGSVANLFKVDDIVLGQVWNADESEQRYYKRKVIAVSTDSITLSKNIADGDGVPQPKDIMVQYGSYSDTSRQYVIVRDVIGGGYERMLSGLTTVYANGNEYYFAGRQSGSTPRWFVGDANGQHASYQNGVLNITGRLSVTTQVDKGNGTYESLSNYLSSLQDQIDGNIQTWYATGEPTLQNYPASTWPTVEDKNNHIGDLYYESETGKAYRFMLDGNTYKWVPIADEDIAAALALAQQNQTAIAGLAYLKAATNQGTLVQGGLVLTSMIQLGQTEEGTYKVYSGINGIMDTSALGNGIAAWYGGSMADIGADSTLTDFAKSLFRFDGSGYLASGNIKWDLNGNGEIPGISWNNGRITLSPDIYLQGGDRLTQIVDAVNRMYTQFAYDSHDNIVVKPTDAFYIPTSAPQYPLAGGVALWYDYNGNYSEIPSGGGGGETLTVTKNGQSWLSYDGSQAVTLNLVVPTKVSDLDNDSGFLTASTLPIASANTLGGIKVGNNLTIDANGVLSAANSYVLPTASSSVKGGIKVGNTLTISNEVLNVVVGSVAQSNTGFVTGGDVYSAIAAAVTSALHYRGMSSTALTDGGTETAIIGGVALTPQSGDVVIYNGFEFLWENNVWNKLGDDTSYALKTIQINGDGTYITGGGDLTATRTLTLSAAVIASLGKADSALQSVAFSDLTSHPTTLSGYGITDAYTKSEADTEYAKYLPLAGNSVATKVTGNIILGNGVYLQGLRTDGTSIRNLIGEGSSNTVDVGNSSQGLYLITDASNVIHTKNGTNYTMYDSSNLTKSILTTLLESDSGYYLPLTAGSGKKLTGPLYFDVTSANKSIYANLSGGAFEAIRFTTDGHTYFGIGNNAGSRNMYLYGKLVQFTFGASSSTKSLVLDTGVIRPGSNSDVSLGTSSYKWKEVYATTFYGALSGNASTATKLETARTLWGQSFDGSANVSGSLTGVTDITASGLATLPNIHAATSLSIPKVAPDTTASWYDSSHAYLWSDSEGNYAESASGGGGGGGETLTITKNGSAWLSYDGSAAVSLNLVVPTTLAELTDDSTHRVVTDTQISNWGTAYTNNHTHSNKSVLDGIASTDITAWNGKYAKPSGGIPKTDLASAVQTTLSNADTAYGWGNHASAGYLTSSSLDGYVNEIATGTGNYISGVSKSGKKLTFTYGTLPTTIAWGSVTGKPTTISGYGITDAKIETPSGTSNRKITLGSNNFTIYSWALASAKPSYTFSEIGSKPTTIAGYGITDAIQKGEYYMPTNSFGSTLKGMQINSLNDGFYAMDKRTTVTLTGFDNNTKASVLFDADYESKRIISQGGTGVVLMEVASGTFATYTYGYIYVSFYNNASPASVSIRAYGTKSGTEGWYNYGAATDILNTTGSHCFRAYNGNIYNIKKWEITIVAKSDIDCWVTQIEHSWTRGSQAMMSAVTKFAIKQDLYGEVVAPKFTVRGGTSSQFLKADGSVDSNTYALSSALGSYVPTSRKVNNKALSADITLSLDDVADGSTRKLADYLPLTAGSTKALTGDLYFDSSTAAKNIYYKDSSNANLRALIMQPAGSLVVGYDLPAKSYSLYLDGYNEYIRFGSTRQYSLLFNGADGTVRSSTGANLVSLGYRSNNTLFPFNYIYSTYSVASKALAAQTGKIMLGLATFTIANTKKARTFAIKIPYNGNPHCFKIGIYSSYGTLPSSTITVSTGGLNKTASAYAALYPSYSVEGSFAGRVAFARDANTDAANFYILIGSYADGYEYQSGYIAIEEVIVTSNPSGSDEYLQFAYTLSDLDSESTFTKISECANADAHFASVTAPKGYFETELVIPKVAPSSPDSSKAYLWIDTNGNYAELPNA